MIKIKEIYLGEWISKKQTHIRHGFLKLCYNKQPLRLLSHTITNLFQNGPLALSLICMLFGCSNGFAVANSMTGAINSSKFNKLS